MVTAADGVERLHQPHGRVRRFCQGELLCLESANPSTGTDARVPESGQPPRETLSEVKKLGGGEGGLLTTETRSRAAVEGQKPPARSGGGPSLRMELVGVGAVQIAATVHGGEVVADDCSCRDEDGGLAVGTAAEREDGIYESGP